jgi:EpsI family protein
MKSPSLRFSYRVICTCALLSATLVASKVTAHRTTEALAQPLDSIPFTLGEFSGSSNPPLTENVLKELKASNYISRRYRKSGLEADLFIAYYAQQRAGESMHSPKHCLPGAGWEIWDYDSMPIAVGGREFTVNKYSISHAGERKQVLYWYESRERVFSSEYLGKLLLARDALMHNSTAASLVRIIVPDQPGAADAAGRFASVLIPEIQRCFGQ